MDPGAPLHHNLNQSHHGNGYDMTLMGSNMDITRSKVKKTKDTPGLDQLIDRMHTGLDVSMRPLTTVLTSILIFQLSDICFGNDCFN